MLHFSFAQIIVATVALSLQLPTSFGQQTQPFDGRPWNISTGNASTFYIQSAPNGAYPKPGVTEEAPPDAAWLKRMHDAGLVAYEDYISWGAVERTRGTW